MTNFMVFDDKSNNSLQDELSASAFRNHTEAPFSPRSSRFIVSIILNLTAAVLNAFVLFLFSKSPSVRKPFNFYLANLCSANLAFTSLNYGVSIINESLTARHPPLLFCAFVRYLVFISGAAININSHFLIAMNRLWAIMWSESYRRFHSHLARTAARGPKIICLVMWVCICVWLLPGVVIDTMTPRAQPDIRHCSATVINPPVFAPLSVIVLLNLPIDIVLLTYPFILYKQLARVRAKSATTIATVDDSAITRHSPPVQNTIGQDTIGKAEPKLNENPAGSGRTSRHNRAIWNKKRARNAHFRTLSFLILTVLGSLFPAHIFFTALAFGTYINGLLEIVMLLYSLSPILDPLICVLTVGSFRRALKNLWH